MVTLSQVEAQLDKAGCNFKFWGRAEVRELCKILVPGETIILAVNGRYEGGFAMLCLTDHRLLLIDRKPMFLTLEDIRFDMISEIDFHARLLENTVRIITPARQLVFRSWNQKRLRQLLTETQARVMEIRQHFMLQQLQAARSQKEQKTATQVGGLVLQGGWERMLPLNPYSKSPFFRPQGGYSRLY